MYRMVALHFLPKSNDRIKCLKKVIGELHSDRKHGYCEWHPNIPF